MFGAFGKALTASAVTQAIYAAIVVAALARICSSLEPEWSGLLLDITAFAWVAAFLGFAASFGPLLVGAQRGTKSAE